MNSPYKVFTPFRRAWLEHGWRAPAGTGPDVPRWLHPPRGLADPLPEPKDEGHQLPEPGEAAALRARAAFRDGPLASWPGGSSTPTCCGTSPARLGAMPTAASTTCRSKLPGGPPPGYPAPMVDHATERADALVRYQTIKSG